MIQTSMALALAGLSFMLTVIWGGPLIRILLHFKLGESIRVDGPERHFAKLGTPTMGGIMIILPVVLITVLLNAASLIGPMDVLGSSVLLPTGVLILYGGGLRLMVGLPLCVKDIDFELNPIVVHDGVQYRSAPNPLRGPTRA